MNQSTTLFVGLDVHKDSISVAYAAATGAPIRPTSSDRSAPARRDIDKLMRRLQSKAARPRLRLRGRPLRLRACIAT